MSGNASLHDDDSDHESLQNALSPTDGYFNERHTQPQDVLVPDPSQTNSQSDKEREAREQLQADRAASAHTQAPESSRPQPIRQPTEQSPVASPTRAHFQPSSRSVDNERTPLLASAPPAYSPPSPGSPYHARTFSQAESSNEGNGNMGGPETFFPNRDPENLGGEQPLLGRERRQRSWRKSANQWIHENQNRIMKSILLLLAILAAIGIIWDIATSYEGRKEIEIDPIPVITDPIDEEVQHQCPSELVYGAEFAWNNPGTFRFLQLLSGTSHSRGESYSKVDNMGKLHIRPASADAQSDILLTTRFYGSSSTVLKDFAFERNDNGVGFYLPSAIPSINADSRPCIYMNATIWVKPNINLDLLSTQSQTLSVTIHPGLAVNARELAVSSVVSSITALANPSSSNASISGPRSIKIITETGSISGAYPLYDNLCLRSMSGSITASITPKAVDPRSHAPALLNVDSGSGSVHLKTPILDSLAAFSRRRAPEDDIPSRDYQSTISSHSGSVAVQLLHGSRTSITSLSGHVGADLTPYGNPYLRSDLDVTADSGSIDTTIHSSASDPGRPLRRLYSKFTYETGSLKTKFPATWEGKVRGRTLTGGITVDWPGMIVDRYEREGTGWKWAPPPPPKPEAPAAPGPGFPGTDFSQWEDDFWGAVQMMGVENVPNEDVANDVWGWRFMEGHKGRGDAVLNFDGVTGSARLLGEGGKEDKWGW